MLRLPPNLPRRYSIVVVLWLIGIWLWITLGRSVRPLSEELGVEDLKIGGLGIPANNGHSGPDPDNDVFDFPPIESEAIKTVCAKTEWNSTVVFTCDNSVGGPGNIRNSVLSCVRYAISAGGSLVIPRIVLRDASDIAQIRTGDLADLSYMFDKHHFKESLRLSCPGLKLIDSLDEVIDSKATHEPLKLHAESFEKKIPRPGYPHPELWRSQFYSWLANSTEPKYDGLAIVAFKRSYLQYPIYSDGEEFATNFGNILKFPTAVRAVATTTLRRLSETYNTHMNLFLPTIPNAFLGAHLRTELDAVKGWPTDFWVYGRYSTQSKFYLEQAVNNSLPLIYVASGNATEVAKLAHDAQPLKIAVTTKYELLKGEDKIALDKLAWDQQALVDFLVMLKASSFGGIAHSSFAWNIALKRHIYAKVRDHLNGPQMLSDDLSQIYGTPGLYPEYPSCIWP